MTFRTRLLICILPAVCSLPLISVSASSARADSRRVGPTIKFELANGAKVSDVVTILARATADGNADIEKVEFAIDGKLVYTDTSVPYSYDWATLESTEGEHALSATVFDSKGATAVAKITLVVDNELSLGAKTLASSAMDAIKAKDFDKASIYAKRALKLEPGNLGAAASMASVYRSKGEFDNGIALLSSLTLPDNDVVIRQELIYQLIQKGDNSPNTEDFLKLASSAADVYKKVIEARVIQAKQLQGDDVDKAIAIGDAYFGARMWDASIKEYERAGSLDTAPLKITNRVILTLLSAGKTKEAFNLLSQMDRSKKGDDVTRAMWGHYYMSVHQFAKAATYINPLVEKSVMPALILATYMDLSTAKSSKSREIAAKAVAIEPDITDTQMLLAYTERDPTDARHAFLNAIALTPTLPEAYALRGLQTIILKDTNRFQTADPMIEYAVKLDPKNTYAMMARAVSYLAQKRSLEAEPVVLALIEADKTAADAHFAASILYQQLDKQIKVSQEVKAGNLLDPERWGDIFVPKPTEFAVRVLRYRFSPIISPSSLYLTMKEQ